MHDYFKIVIGSCKLMQPTIFFANTCMVFDNSTNQICWKLIHMYGIRWCMSEIIDFSKIAIGSFKLMQLLGAFSYSCKYVHLFTMIFLVVLPALSYTHRITFVGRFKCIGRMACSLSKTVSQPHFGFDYWWLTAYNDSHNTCLEIAYALRQAAAAWSMIVHTELCDGKLALLASQIFIWTFIVNLHSEYCEGSIVSVTFLVSEVYISLEALCPLHCAHYIVPITLRPLRCAHYIVPIMLCQSHCVYYINPIRHTLGPKRTTFYEKVNIFFCVTGYNTIFFEFFQKWSGRVFI